jgi:ferredoxin
MGSGQLSVMDEDVCVVDTARYFLDFSQKESCGECVPCRLGTRQMSELLNKITSGNGTPNDLEILAKLAEAILNTSLCGLGRSAPNPVLTTLKYFRDEYTDHVMNHACPAKVCPSLMHYFILPEKCIGCDLCAKNCPAAAISGAKKEVHVINQSLCIKCGRCYQVCPTKVRAVAKKAGSSPTLTPTIV